MPIRSEKPLNYSGQVWRGIDDKFPKKIHNATATSDGLMSAEDKAKLDSIDATIDDRVYDVASWESDGLLSMQDKKKLDNIEENANNYIHPNTPEIRHVTDKQISYWDSKASTAVATQKTNGLMSATDKVKLDNIEENANNYIHPNTPEIRHVTDEQIKYWNEKASTAIATHGKDGLMSAMDKRKLDSLENYIHPNNEGIRHVSDAEKDYWNSKADKKIVTNSENGLMPFEDKIKLDSVEQNANYYIHPDDENTRHVTDEQIKFWDSKIPTQNATHTKDGLMSFEDKIKLDNLENYEHPDDEYTRHVTDEQIKRWNSNVTTQVATTTTNGLMSFEDKRKLNSIEENANNYIHPDDENTRHVSEEEKERWNSKADTTPVTSETDGLMSSADKNKLDSIKISDIESDTTVITAEEFLSGERIIIPIENMTNKTQVTIGLDYSSVTLEQYNAAGFAKFITKPVEEGIELICFGTVPSIDIPIAINIIRKI